MKRIVEHQGNGFLGEAGVKSKVPPVPLPRSCHSPPPRQLCIPRYGTVWQFQSHSRAKAQPLSYHSGYERRRRREQLKLCYLHQGQKQLARRDENDENVEPYEDFSFAFSLFNSKFYQDRYRKTLYFLTMKWHHQDSFPFQCIFCAGADKDLRKRTKEAGNDSKDISINATTRSRGKNTKLFKPFVCLSSLILKRF